MMLSPHRKLLVFPPLILCSPLYVMLRFYYGSSFFRRVVFALLLNIVALPFLHIVLPEQPALMAYTRQFSLEYMVALIFSRSMRPRCTSSG